MRKADNLILITVVTVHTARFNVTEFCILLAEYIYMLRMAVRYSSDYVPEKHFQLTFVIRTTCVLWFRNWMLYINWISFRLEMLNKIYAKRDAFRIDRSELFIMRCNTFYSLLPQYILQPTASVHSTAYCLTTFYSLLPAAWFPSGHQKNSRGAFKDRLVSVYRWLTYNAWL
jgi:hypothetical protein